MKITTAPRCSMRATAVFHYPGLLAQPDTLLRPSSVEFDINFWVFDISDISLSQPVNSSIDR
jgi:hypothetical protein